MKQFLILFFALFAAMFASAAERPPELERVNLFELSEFQAHEVVNFALQPIDMAQEVLIINYENQKASMIKSFAIVQLNVVRFSDLPIDPGRNENVSLINNLTAKQKINNDKYRNIQKFYCW